MPIPPYIAFLRGHVGHALLMMPATTAIIRDDAGRVLLIRRGDERGWSLPGGMMEPGERIADCLVREVWREGDALVVRLRDEAVPFDPTSVPPLDVTLPPEQRVLEGMGIYLIRQAMDEMAHRITLQRGNELTLVKRGVGGMR